MSDYWDATNIIVLGFMSVRALGLVSISIDR